MTKGKHMKTHKEGNVVFWSYPRRWCFVYRSHLHAWKRILWSGALIIALYISVKSLFLFVCLFLGSDYRLSGERHKPLSLNCTEEGVGLDQLEKSLFTIHKFYALLWFFFNRISNTATFSTFPQICTHTYIYVFREMLTARKKF